MAAQSPRPSYVTAPSRFRSSSAATMLRRPAGDGNTSSRQRCEQTTFRGTGRPDVPRYATWHARDSRLPEQRAGKPGRKEVSQMIHLWRHPVAEIRECGTGLDALRGAVAETPPEPARLAFL